MALIPPNLVDVTTALRSRGRVGVCGIVVDTHAGVPFKTSRSFCVTFTIKDCDLENGHVWDGLKIKYFGENENHLPQVRARDVILLPNLNVGVNRCKRPYQTNLTVAGDISGWDANGCCG